uniref:TBC1 domain family member 31 n=1 Tax=Chromera velia CCMP2878 TaxID=1169474 RepID=A0A0G4HK26_9ALVE|eukprot:Cvel_28464.t1-p1 / transcript=Cvel_28464.t1 / gene=Cvel_28464 / organism=Chromera_velia_CCMP2878 / gene_product=WD repeat-containing protein 67, putative / transcript_product=WD repeat-containing protein 67, putative / location=Cvel_scaffold3730:1525-12475(-) / protein_length=1556 / sequence_SO=supercontig / SO=protein_coding / is_pseudo=false
MVNNVKLSSGNGRIWTTNPQTCSGGLVTEVVNGYKGGEGGGSGPVPFLEVAFNGDGTSAALGDKRGRVFVFHFHANRYVLVGEVEGPVSALSFTRRREEEVMVAYGRHVTIFDLGSHKATAQLGGHYHPVRSVDAAAQGGWALSASADVVIVWDVRDWSKKRCLFAEESSIRRAVFSALGDLIAACTADSSVAVWTSVGQQKMFQLSLNLNDREDADPVRAPASVVEPEMHLTSVALDSRYVVVGGSQAGTAVLAVWTLEAREERGEGGEEDRWIPAGSLLHLADFEARSRRVEAVMLCAVPWEGQQATAAAVLTDCGALRFVRVKTLQVLFEIDATEGASSGVGRAATVAFSVDCFGRYALSILSGGMAQLRDLHSVFEERRREFRKRLQMGADPAGLSKFLFRRPLVQGGHEGGGAGSLFGLPSSVPVSFGAVETGPQQVEMGRYRGGLLHGGDEDEEEDAEERRRRATPLEGPEMDQLRDSETLQESFSGFDRRIEVDALHAAPPPAQGGPRGGESEDETWLRGGVPPPQAPAAPPTLGLGLSDPPGAGRGGESVTVTRVQRTWDPEADSEGRGGPVGVFTGSPPPMAQLGGAVGTAGAPAYAPGVAYFTASGGGGARKPPDGGARGEGATERDGRETRRDYSRFLPEELPPVPVLSRNVYEPLYQILRLPQGSKHLNTERLRSFLLYRGAYPDEYRALVWRFLLQLPLNESAFEVLCLRGPHPSFFDLHKRFPLYSRKLFRRLEKTLSCLAHWCPFLAKVLWLPAFVFPFVKIFGSDLLLTFEIVMTVLLHWGVGWFDFFPSPPLKILSNMSQALATTDPQLHRHISNLCGGPLTSIWAPLQTVMSEVLGRNEWLRLWDHLVTHHTERDLLPAAVVSYLRCFRGTILQFRDSRTLDFFLRSQHPVDMRAFLATCYGMRNETDALFDPVPAHLAVPGASATFLPEASPSIPLPLGSYPHFDVAPRYIKAFEEKLAGALASTLQTGGGGGPPGETTLVVDGREGGGRGTRVMERIAEATEQLATQERLFREQQDELSRVEEERRKEMAEEETRMLAEQRAMDEANFQRRLDQIVSIHKSVVGSMEQQRVMRASEAQRSIEEMERRKEKKEYEIAARLREEALLNLEFESIQKLHELLTMRQREESQRHFRQTLDTKARENDAQDELVEQYWRIEDEKRRLKQQLARQGRERILQSEEDANMRREVEAELRMGDVTRHQQLVRVQRERFLRQAAEEQQDLDEEREGMLRRRLDAEMQADRRQHELVVEEARRTQERQLNRDRGVYERERNKQQLELEVQADRLRALSSDRARTLYKQRVSANAEEEGARAAEDERALRETIAAMDESRHAARDVVEEFVPGLRAGTDRFRAAQDAMRSAEGALRDETERALRRLEAERAQELERIRRSMEGDGGGMGGAAAAAAGGGGGGLGRTRVPGVASSAVVAAPQGQPGASSSSSASALRPPPRLSAAAQEADPLGVEGGGAGASSAPMASRSGLIRGGGRGQAAEREGIGGPHVGDTPPAESDSDEERADSGGVAISSHMPPNRGQGGQG